MTSWWLARAAADLPAGDGWLGPDEKAYADRQRFAKRRNEFLLARYTVKTAAAGLLGLPGTELARVQVRHAPSGAPDLWVDDRPSGWQVSLTDRADWAVCLLDEADERVGCDLELVEPRSEGFVGDWFTPPEQALVHAAADEDTRRLTANLIWSAKESALKVLTTGLRRDTRTVRVTTDVVASGTGWQPLTVAVLDGPLLPGWWRRLGAFVLTVVTARAADPPVAMGGERAISAAEPRHPWLDQPLV